MNSEVDNVHFKHRSRTEVSNHVKLRRFYFASQLSPIALASREICDPTHKIPCDDRRFGPAPRKIAIAFHLPVDLELSSHHRRFLAERLVGPSRREASDEMAWGAPIFQRRAQD
jgi:hypothetical protein